MLFFKLRLLLINFFNNSDANVMIIKINDKKYLKNKKGVEI